MKTLSTLPVLFLFGFFVFPNQSSESNFRNQNIDIQSIKKEIHLENQNIRTLIEPTSEVQTFIFFGLEIDKKYSFSFSDFSNCEPQFLNSKTKKLDFEAGQTSKSVQILGGDCSEPFYLSIECLDCEIEQNQTENSMTLAVNGASDNFLVEEILFPNGCGIVDNVQGIGPIQGRGQFCCGTFGLVDGVILSSGDIQNAPGPNTSESTGNNMGGGGGDPDLDMLIGGLAMFDVVGIEFDFTPSGSFIEFDYIFASEEYCEYVGTGFNDVFGFFISGPGINGPFSNNAVNIAVIPGTNDPVTINSVNHTTHLNLFYPNAASCGSTVNPGFSFDGYTEVLNAFQPLFPNETYHIKIVIGDGGDGIFDSAVFLGANATPVSASIEPPNEILCNVPDITLDASNSSQGGQYDYLWTGPNGFTSTAFPIVTVSEPGVYCIEVTNTFSGDVCQDCVDVIQSNTEAQISIIPPGIFSCSVFEVELDGSLSSQGSDYAYEWDGPNGFKSNNFPSIFVNEPGTYCLEVLDLNTGEICSNCVNVSETGWNVKIDLPDTLTCTQVEVELNGSNSVFSPNFDFEWTGPNGFAVSDWPNIFVDTPGVYTLTLTDLDSGEICMDSVEVIQTTTPLDAPDLIGPDTIWFGSVGYFYSPNNDSTITKYHWQNSEGTSLFGDSTTNFIVFDLGDSTETELCLSVENDCSVSMPSCLNIERDSSDFQLVMNGSKNVCAGALETYWLENEDTTVTDIEWVAFGNDTLIIIDSDTADVRWDTLHLGVVCANIESDSFGFYQICELIEIDTNTTPAVGLIDTTFCSGGSVKIGNQTIDSSGFFTVNIDSNLGCDSLVEATVSVLEAESKISSPTILGCGETLTLDGSNSTSNTINGSVLSYNWTGPTFQSPNGMPKIDINEGGQYCLKITHEKSGVICESESCVTVIEDDTVPNTPNISGVTQSCLDNSETYSLSNFDPLIASCSTWSMPNGEIITQINAFEISVVWDNPDGGELCVTADNACGSSAQFCMNVTLNTAPEDPILSAPTEVCDHEDIFVEVTNPKPNAVYYWTIGGNIIQTVVPNFTISNPLNPETICVETEEDCGISGQICMTIQVNSVPEMPEIFGGEMSCEDFIEAFSIIDFSSDLNYQWTVPASAILTGSGENVEVEFTETGFQNICLTSENDCGLSDEYCLEVEVLENLSVQNIQIECEPSNIAYTLSFEISGGTPSTYEVMGMDGSLNNQQFTSDIQLIGGGYDITITDMSGCLGVNLVEPPFECECFTDAGSMDGNLAEFCGIETAVGIHFDDEFLDGNDAIYFILAADENDPLGSILAENSEPAFDFDAVLMSKGTTYYIFAVAANSNPNSEPDFNDPCLSISNPNPIVFTEANLNISITGDTTICAGETVQLNASAPGAVNFEWHPSATLSCSNCPNPVASPNGNSVYTVTLTDDEGCVGLESVDVFVQCLTVYDTIEIGEVAIQSLNLPPWLVVQADACIDEEEHTSVGWFPNGFFYVGLSEGADTMCIPLQHPTNIFNTEVFTLYIEVEQKAIFQLDGNDTEMQISADNFGEFKAKEKRDFIQVFPNPISDFVNIISNESELRKVEIFALDGRLVQSENLSGRDARLKLNLKTEGIYLFKIQTESGVYFEKICR